MSNGASLGRLTELAGIGTEYWDIWGNHHQVPDPARRSILGALGLPAGDEAQIVASIDLLQAAEWRRWLPPVAIAYENEPAELLMVLPADRAEWPVVLQVTTEAGERIEVVFRPTDTMIAERRGAEGGEVRRYRVPLPSPLPCGYHTVFAEARPDETARLIVAPRRCWLPAELESGGRTWGLSAQLYTLRRPGNWGIGDFTDLRELVDAAADLGASVIGLNPLHVLFLARPEEASPYSPSSRLFLNPLYIDAEAIEEFAVCPEAQAVLREHQGELAACRDGGAVAYRRIKPIKLAVLERIFACFVAARGGSDSATAERQREFDRFRSEQGAALHRYALFEALTEELEGKPWPQWPEGFRRPDTPAVAGFAHTHAARVEFFEFLQWQADRQLASAQARAVERGLPIGIYRDLAVGADRAGADAWSDQEVIVQEAKVGCPPDPFNMLGQDWGIPPLHPLTMRAQGYAPFIAMLRANMRHAGGLRIDHVMGLKHLFWIPATGSPADGAYVKYPFEELLAVLALESQRHRCLVVGEDLGTVPEGFRETMAAANVLSYRVLYFEKDGDRFRRPDEYPDLALACVTTHDLATIEGFWRGADIDLKQRLALYPSVDAEQGERGARVHDRWLLLQALRGQGLLPNGIDPDNIDGSPMSAQLIAAMHAYLARSPAQILLVQIDDLMRETDQINLPGTVFERPNWRRRLSMRVGELLSAPVVQALQPALADRSAAG
ncbi:MAG TPA: 4-alpha-glucanotransferase [Rhodospirillales bacterium]|nr:4-alpha-glucanotransferase [Rhodospirillales bacterium]